MDQEQSPQLLRRLELQALLEATAETENVYFQPPPNFVMEYPCVVYEIDDETVLYADNIPYRRDRRYQVTVIDADPDSEMPDKIATLPYVKRNRRFSVGNLNHDVFAMFF